MRNEFYGAALRIYALRIVQAENCEFAEREGKMAQRGSVRD